MSATLVARVNLLPGLVEQLPGAVEAYLLDTAARALLRMQEFTPVDTGDLFDSEYIDPVDAHTVEVIAGTDHAYAVHFGTSRMPARPFIVWTADALRDSFPAGALEVILDLVR